MKWINPRDKLPESGQLIWILVIENKEGDRVGLPSASLHIAEAGTDKYGMMFAQRINYKGYPYESFYFYEWWGPKENDDDCRWDFQTHDDDQMITAWIPYNKDLPEWNFIDIDESKKIMSINEKHKTLVDLAKATKDNYYFIHLDDHLPLKDGVYVVANKNGVWLSKYEVATCKPWIAPNGEPVEGWYPVPNHY